MRDFFAFVGALVTVFIVGIIGSVVNGFILVKLWACFIVPQFGLPSLRIPYALGISILVGMLTAHSDYKCDHNDSKSPIWVEIISSLASPFLILLFGYIVKQFI